MNPSMVLMILLLVGTSSAPVVVDSTIGDSLTPKNGILWRVERVGEIMRKIIQLTPEAKAL